MKERTRGVFGLLTVAGFLCTVSVAGEPDWASMSYTTHEAYQAVDSAGQGTFLAGGGPVKFRGVIINEPELLLDPTPSAPYFMGGQWQIHIQAVDDGDFGGTAMWMGQMYGRLPFTPPDDSYSDAAWLDELDRLNHDPDTGHVFQPGDLVEVRARVPGLNYQGKTNVNEAHTTDPGNDFDVLLLEADYGLPHPTLLTLADVKDADNEWIIDPTRATGAEHHQCTLVRFNDVELIETENWGQDSMIAMTDGMGRTVPVLLGFGQGFVDFAPPTGPVDVIGLWDQADGDNGSDGDWWDGYRLWVVDYYGDGCTLPGPWRMAGDANCDGVVDFADINPFVAALSGESVYLAQYPCCDWLNSDCNGDGVVDFADINPFVAVLGG